MKFYIKKTNSALRVRKLLICVALLSGCAGNVMSTKPVNALPNNETKSDAEIATIFTPVPLLTPRGFVKQIDGTGYGNSLTGYPIIVRLTPGEHLITIHCVADTRTATVEISATVQAGHFYELHCRDTGENAVSNRLSITGSMLSIRTTSGKATTFLIDRGKDFTIPQAQKR